MPAVKQTQLHATGPQTFDGTAHLYLVLISRAHMERDKARQKEKSDPNHGIGHPPTTRNVGMLFVNNSLMHSNTAVEK